MRNSFDFDDLTGWLSDNKNTLLVLGLGGLAVLNFMATGGLQKIQSQLNREAELNATVDQQAQAEKLFAEQGCSAQVLDAETRTANLKPGSIVIDPMSITRENPQGTTVNGGYVCSLDGSIFQVKDGTAHLIGTSPNIRKEMVMRGLPKHVRAMEQRASQLYGGQR